MVLSARGGVDTVAEGVRRGDGKEEFEVWFTAAWFDGRMLREGELGIGCGWDCGGGGGGIWLDDCRREAASE